MGVLTTILVVLVAVAILYEVAQRVGVPYPALIVLGGVGLAFIPGLPRLALEPDLVLLVFLPPLLFSAAVGTPLRDLRTNLAPIARLSIGLVLFTMAVVAIVAQWAVPSLGWAAALTLGAIVAPTDALAATTVFRRLGTPRIVVTLIEGEGLLNDATALIAYRAAVVAVASGSFILAQALGDFVVAAVGGVLIGVLVGRIAIEILRRLDDPPVEVAISLVIPFAAYLPADYFHLSGVLAAVAAGLVIGRRLGTILTPSSRILWLSTWKMVGFILNGFVFVLIGLQLPEILAGLGTRSTANVLGLIALVSGAVIAARFVFIFTVSLLPGTPRRVLARTDPGLAWRLTFVVSWAGLRGAVSLAAALALPATFPERNLILLLTFAVILVTLVGQGLSLPLVLRWAKSGRRRARRGRSHVCAGAGVPGRPRRGRTGTPRLADTSALVRPPGVRPARSRRTWRRRTPTKRQPPRSASRRGNSAGPDRTQSQAAIQLRDPGEINDPDAPDNRARAGSRRAQDGRLTRRRRLADSPPNPQSG